MVSNRTLALFVIATVIVSLGGTLMSLTKLDEIRQLRLLTEKPVKVTGLASGIVTLSINSTANCEVNTNVSFGSGSRPASTYILSSDVANSNGFYDCTAPLNCTGMHINNTGNVDLNVTLQADKDAVAFIGSQTNLDATDFQWYFRNGTYAGTLAGCVQNGSLSGNVGTSAVKVCSNLSSIDTNDIMTLEFNVTLEPDVSAGSKTATMTIVCQQV